MIELGTPCESCQRPMRPNGWAKDDAPWTIGHAGRGVCKACASKGITGTRRLIGDSVAPGTPCVTCETPMRPIRSTKGDPTWPEHSSAGECRRCYQNRRARAVREACAPKPEPHHSPFVEFTPPGLDSEDETVRDHARDLDLWLRDRRARGIPPQGIGTHTHTTRKKEKVA